MEIFKELNSQESKEFENLLNSQLSKTKIEENTVIDGTVTKITNKYVFLYYSCSTHYLIILFIFSFLFLFIHVYFKTISSIYTKIYDEKNEK